MGCGPGAGRDPGSTGGLGRDVILVRPANPKAVTAEALVRMHGELVSAGFDVQITASTPGADPRASLEQTASGNNVDAVVALLGDVSPGSVEVWVIDRVTGKSVVRRIPNQPESNRAAEILAIRAIELLRASLLEIAMAGSGELVVVAKPPPVAVTRFVDRALDSRRDSRWAIEVGGSGVASFDGVGPALLPWFGSTWRWAPTSSCGLPRLASGLEPASRPRRDGPIWQSSTG